jgi:hypothetical protein
MAEDSKLKDAVQTHGGKNWYSIAVLFSGRTRCECYYRWKDVVYPNIVRMNGRTSADWASRCTDAWSEDEDAKLKDLVQMHGDKDWGVIAPLVPGQTQKNSVVTDGIFS